MIDDETYAATTRQLKEVQSQLAELQHELMLLGRRIRTLGLVRKWYVTKEPHHKILPSQATEIINKRKAGVTLASLSQEYDLSPKRIREICTQGNFTDASGYVLSRRLWKLLEGCRIPILGDDAPYAASCAAFYSRESWLTTRGSGDKLLSELELWLAHYGYTFRDPNSTKPTERTARQWSGEANA